MEKLIEKVVFHDFSKLKGKNAHEILDAFEKQAKGQGWNSREIELVKDQAMSDDYGHLWKVICIYSKTVIN